MYKGRPIACGGRTGGYGSSMPDTCYEYVPGTGSWTSIGNLVRHGVLEHELCLKHVIKSFELKETAYNLGLCHQNF